MSNTFKMPEPAGYLLYFAELKQMVCDNDLRIYRALMEDHAHTRTNLYTSEQVKEILEQCIKEIEVKSTSRDHAAQLVLNIKEMVK